MVRTIQTSMCKDTTSIIPLTTPKLASRWARSVGLCGLSLTHGVPVVQNFYRSLTKGSTEALPVGQTYKLGMHMLAERMGDHGVETPSVTCRLSFYKAFGIEPDRQEILERYYDNVEVQHKVVPNHIILSTPSELLLL
jgi:hypothetical protein